MKNKSPWAWIPTLYFTEGLPYVIVMTVSLIMYKRLDISNTEITLYTSWLYLPWVIKPFWSPFIDLIKTKRWWIVTMQLLIGAGLGGVAFFIPAPFFFQATLALFWLMAFSSATHDIAADGFYMLALNEHQQSFFVGIRSTFYRLSMVMGQGLLIMLAGTLESSTGLTPIEFRVQSTTDKIEVYEQQFPAITSNEMAFVFHPQNLLINTENITADSLNRIKTFVKTENEKNKFIKADTNNATVSNDNTLVGNAGVVMVRLTHQPEEGKEVILHSGYLKGDKNISLITGERLAFTADNWDKPAYIVFQLDPKLDENVICHFKGVSGNIKLAWSISFFVLAGFIILLFVYHRFVLPRPDSDKPVKGQTGKNIIDEFIETFISFFKKEHMLSALAFLLLYRLGEAQLVKIASPFLLDSYKAGGMALSTAQVGFVYGTVGIVALTIGGILGGLAVARDGIGKWLWPMVFCMNLPNLVYVYLAYAQPDSFIVACMAVGIEQFGYGFGFTAYMLYMLYISQGEHQTSHYAMCTGFMALGMMLPGMISGWIQESVGYLNFFIWVCICTIPGIIMVRFLKLDKNFGKKNKE